MVRKGQCVSEREKAGKAAHPELSQSGRKVLPVMQQERESPVKTNRRRPVES